MIVKAEWFKLVKKVRKNGALVGLVFLVVVLPIVIVLAQTVTKMMPSASTFRAENATLKLETSKTSFGVGEEFEVDVMLDARAEVNYVISGVDVIIDYSDSEADLEVVKIYNGQALTTVARKDFDNNSKKIKISAANPVIKNAEGMPVGFKGYGKIATVVLKAKKPGKVFFTFGYVGEGNTTDSNVIGFEKGKLVSQQMPKERLLKQPVGLSTSVDAGGGPKLCKEDKDCDLGYSCRATPWGGCPVVKDDNGLEKQVECASAPYCMEIPKLCWNKVGTLESLPVQYEWSDGCKGKPIINEDIACTMATVKLTKAEVEQYQAWARSRTREELPEGCGVPVPSHSPFPTTAPSPKPRPKAQLQVRLNMLNKVGNEDSLVTQGTLYGVDAGQVKGVMIASQFGDMIEETTIISPPERPRPEWIGPPLSSPAPSPITIISPSEKPMAKLSSFVTDKGGRATVVIPQEYEGKKMYLFVRTPSHLLKATKAVVTIPSIPDCLWKLDQRRCSVPLQIQTVKFDNLVPGDIYIAEGQIEQDNVINSFDAIELIRSLGERAKIIMAEIQCFKAPCNPPDPVVHYHKADLNGDMLVNTRDLKILLRYMGQKGDEATSR